MTQDFIKAVEDARNTFVAELLTKLIAINTNQRKDAHAEIGIFINNRELNSDTIRINPSNGLEVEVFDKLHDMWMNVNSYNEQTLIEIGTQIEKKYNEIRTDVFCRLGIVIQPTKEQIEVLFGAKDNATSADMLVKIIQEGNYRIEGETYIPSSEIDTYNMYNGTKYTAEDVVCEF